MAEPELKLLISLKDMASSQLQQLQKNTTGLGIALGAIGAGGAATLATIGAMTESAASNAHEIELMAEKYGLATDEVQKLNYVASQSGADMGDLAIGVKTLDRNLYDAQNGSAAAAKKFADLGISWADLAKMSPDEQIQTVLAHINAAPAQFDKVGASVNLLGRGGVNLIPLADNITDLMQKADDLNLVIDKNLVEGAGHFQQSLLTLKSQVENLKNELGDALATALTPFTDGLSKDLENLKPVIDQIANWIANNPSWVTAILLTVAALTLLTLGAGALLLIMPGLTAAMTLFGISSWAALGPVGPVLAIIALLIFAGALLIANWDDFSLRFQNLWINMANSVIDAINWIISGINQMISAMNMIPGMNIGQIGEITKLNQAANVKITDVAKPAAGTQNNVTVNVAGSVISQNDLMDTIESTLFGKTRLQNAGTGK
jgi:hypothetical protein